MQNTSLLSYFIQADSVVKSIMLLLLFASFISWVFIFQRGLFLRDIKNSCHDFSERFWNSQDLSLLYARINNLKHSDGLKAIFHAGFKSFIELNQKPELSEQVKLSIINRALRVAVNKEEATLEKHMGFLASVGSVSPYVGLLGTVWGIMHAFQALGHMQSQQLTIALVAPGISEALLATALGLFAAIPAVLAYNRYAQKIESIQSEYHIFQDELAGLLQQQLGGHTHEK